MSLSTAIDGLRTRLATMTGLVRTYPDPPESINEFPSLIVYSKDGVMYYTASGGYSLHTLVAEVYLARQYLPEVVDSAKPWPDRAFAALKADQTLGGAVSHVVWDTTGGVGLRYQTLPLQYNQQLCFGVRFTITVKVNES